jgi:hypothetical protein
MNNIKKEIYFILLGITSVILNKLIELNWFNSVKYILDFRKKYIIVKLRKLV